mgnify:CR=1 FL=1
MPALFVAYSDLVGVLAGGLVEDLHGLGVGSRRQLGHHNGDDQAGDLYKPFFRKNATEKETLMVGRVLVLVLSAIAFFIANSKGSGAQAIMDMVENAWGAFGSSFGPTILLSLFWKRFNYKGAVAGVVSGFVVDLGWLLSGLTASTGVYEIVPGFIVSFLAAYLVARFTEAPNAEAVAIFEEATKPDAD